MSQFFDSNPADRSPQGPKRGPWRQGVPRTWREALDLPETSREPREGPVGETAGESPQQSAPGADPPGPAQGSA